jgi:nucleoside-diphosphate-sugar epimerase
VPWPDDRKAIDVGNVYLDSTKLRETTGWRPVVGLREGLELTVKFYRERLSSYLPSPPPIEKAQ